MQALQLPVADAIREAPATSAALQSMAARHRAGRADARGYHTVRHWEPSAGTWCYQTHIAAPDQPAERLVRVAELFFAAATLPAQPWYPQFLGGECAPLAAATPAGIRRHQLTLGQFELGLPTPRYYRQLLSLAQPDDATIVISARSVNDGPAPPGSGRLAYTLAPNGEVLHWENGRLHWHHICCTPGAGLLPGRLDRWLINALRALRLDRAERATYREEAERFRDWLTTGAPAFID